MDLQERVALKKADRDELYSLKPPFPKTNFLLELSNACNHKCIFCAHQKMKRKVGKMKPEMVKSALTQAYALGTREVGFYATGEPFIVPELAEYIKLAKDIGYTYVYLTSNGSLATPERIRAVVDAGVDSVKFSINAPERKMYAFIHGHDDFDKVFENLVYLNQYRKESGRNYKIYITGILTRYTENMREDYFKVFDGLADQIVFKDVYNQGGYMPEIDYLLRCTHDTEVTRRCNLPFDALCVTYEGYLSVENADFENMLIVADLNKVSLEEGWYGEKMTELRRMFLEDKLEGTICDGCVHHKQAPAEPLMPEYATENKDIFLDWMVRERIKAAGLPYTKLVYVPMAADIIHPGHINLLKKAASLGRVMVGLFSDEAIRSYKPAPYMSFEQRKLVLENIKGVDIVVEQEIKDYEPNLRRYRPDYMVHGTDWRTGPLSGVREKAFAVMSEWGGEIVEPEYTQGVSSSEFKQKVKSAQQADSGESAT
ncbi:MAG: radical SAM protein [Agathobaculum sp.]|uniref:radical SAM protein n=1 Tax=Agathobaculum sp. TaxID=2048138 RepID=UPI0025BF65B7|nr:radical SAM protein [Agathobaculum sp.]MCI7124946.1 radical SAM protein [Agathobaculum sp.]